MRIIPQCVKTPLKSLNSLRDDEAADGKNWDQELPQLPSDRLALTDIQAVAPQLEKRYREGGEHVYNGASAFRILHAVVDRYTKQGTPIDYFESPKLLAKSIEQQQARLRNDDDPNLQVALLHGIVRISKRGHHAAVVARVSKDDAAVLVLDSIADVKEIRRRRTCSPAGKLQASVLRPGTYEKMMFDGFSELPNTSVYFTYLGTQMSISDCASFALLAAKNIAASPQELAMHDSLLAQRKAHLDCTPGMFPQIRRVVRTPGAEGIEGNTHFVLDESKVALPHHYIHAQSRAYLKSYCTRSPFVDENIHNGLLNYHDANRRKVKPVTIALSPKCVLRPIFRKQANISIRQVQIDAVRETETYLEERGATPISIEEQTSALKKLSFAARCKAMFIPRFANSLSQ